MALSHTAPAPAADDRVKARRWAHVEARHVAVAAAGCAALAVVGVVDPAQARFGPPCPLQVTTGLDCPLCGATRATHQLLRRDLAAAADLNALYVVALPVVAALALWWLLRGAAPAWTRRPVIRRTAGVVVAVFAVARNLPWEPWTALAS
jgi:hypothetical protein